MKNFGVTVRYTEPSHDRVFSQYREYKTLGKAAQSFVDSLKEFDFFTVVSVTVVDRQNNAVPHNLLKA